MAKILLSLIVLLQFVFDRDEMGLMELVSGAAVTEIVHSQIEKHIEDECKGNFDTSYLSKLEEVHKFYTLFC